MTDRTVREDLQRLLPEPAVLAAWLVAAAAFVWFYWSSIRHLVHVWWTQEDYGHGFVVPIFAVVLLWLRRDMIVVLHGTRKLVGIAGVGSLGRDPLGIGLLQLWKPAGILDAGVFRGRGDFRGGMAGAAVGRGRRSSS